jgi:hypothetical protein
MESGAIPDESLTASSVYDQYHSAARGRLNMVRETPYMGAWSAKTNDLNQWIQIDLRKLTTFTRVATQGRGDHPHQWVESYSLQYSVDGKQFQDYLGGKTFTGNNDQNCVVDHDLLDPAIDARFIRLLPKSWTEYISLRMELYGCPAGNNTEILDKH